jgi:hypothetical protein
VSTSQFQSVNGIKKRGKQKMASKCEHTDKPHYSGGLCSNCYLAQYYLKRKQKKYEKELKELNEMNNKNKCNT